MKKLISRLGYLLFLLVILLAAGEIFVRARGEKPWKKSEIEVVVSGGDGLFEKDEKLGYRPKIGHFEVEMKGSPVRFSLTIDRQHHRITTFADTLLADLPETWILGCSFTYGWGVNDAETYPFLLQKTFPEEKFVNFGVAGYGTYQSLIQLKTALLSDKNPVRVVLAYGSFHDQRNVIARYWEKAIAPYKMLEGMKYPYVRLAHSDSLLAGQEEITYTPWPLMQVSALSHTLENAWNRREEDQLQAKKVSELLIREIQEICEKEGIQFVLGGIYRNESTTAMLNKFAEEGVLTIDFSEDLDQEALRIHPGDGHPNAKAHAAYARKLEAFFLENPAATGSCK